MSSLPSILLIQGNVGRWDYAGLRLPDALLSIASLPLAHGFHVRIIDQRLDRNWRSSIRDHLASHNTVCCGLTCMTGPQIRHSLEVSRHIRSINSGIPIVWGGVHPSLFPEQTMENEAIDIVVKGEGEMTFLELVQRLRAHESLAGLPGIYYKENGAIVKNPPRAFLTDLDALPRLPYDLVELEKYRAWGLFDGPSMTFSSSRGCPFPCTFCYNTSFNEGKWRAFSAKNTVDRLEQIASEHRVRKFFIQDDNFIVNIARFRELMDELIRRDLGLEWACMGVRADTLARIGDEGLDLMVRAGCKNIDMGIESGSRKILRLIKKDIATEVVLTVNRMMAKHQLYSKCSFMIGFPGETEEEVRMTTDLAIRLAEENPRAFCPIFIYCPYPGTELFDLALRAGLKVPTNLEEWSDFSFDEWFHQRACWLSEDQKARYASICFTSLFAAPAGKSKIASRTLRTLFSLYHPVAKFRLKHSFHHLPIETHAHNVLSGIQSVLPPTPRPC